MKDPRDENSMQELERLRRDVASLKRELHRHVCGVPIEGDLVCDYGLEAANLRGEVAKLRAALDTAMRTGQKGASDG